MNGITTLLYLAMVFVLVLFAWRNLAIEKFRKELLDATESREVNEFVKLMRQYYRVPAEGMFWPPWRRLRSYYQGTDLLKRWEERKCR